MSAVVRRLVDDGIQAALQYAVPAVTVAKRLRFALSDECHQQQRPEMEKAEREVAALRKELGESRAALRLQTARCRQLVAAYSARLRAGDALRDHQLAAVLRGLVALEARLRREQRAIRAQLGQRDAIIHQQQVEISRLRAAQQQPASSAPSATHGLGHAPASRTSSASGGAPPATPSQLIVVNHTCGQDSACESQQQGQQGQQDQTDGRRSHQGQRPRPHPGPHETVVDALSHLRHQEAALRVLELVGPPHGNTATMMPLLNGETACIVEPPADFIEDHDALTPLTPPPDVVASYNEMNRECLELASMAASLRATATPGREKSVCFQDNPVLECVNLILLRDQEDFQEERRGRGQQARSNRTRRSVEESPPPPPTSDPPAWYDGKDKAPSAALPRTRPTPPALPPKPPRLVAQRPAPNGPKAPGPAAPRSSKSPSPTGQPAPAPRETQDVSGHSSPASASPTPASPAPSPEREDANEALRRNFEEFNLDDCDLDGLAQDGDAPRDGVVAKTDARVEADAEADGRPRPEGDGAESGKLNGLPPRDQDLLAGVAGLLTAPAESPGLGAGLGLNPNLTLAQQLAQLAPANYDSFLEATGLSNKSILTPSRMLSNHRSVLKPKDVKHRSRVKAGERCALPLTVPPPGAGPTVKYWTEPFL